MSRKEIGIVLSSEVNKKKKKFVAEVG